MMKRSIVVLCGLLLAAPFAGAAPKGKSKASSFYTYLSKGQLKEAEAALKSTPDDHLSWGRLRYQQGDFGGAIKAYEAIPRAHEDFLRSREELGWAYLRHGDLGALRGLLTHLNTGLVPLENRLEGRVLGAIVHLKQCRYNEVKREIQDFQSELLPIAKAVETDPAKAKLKPLVTEAVLKMRYVKLELLSQLQWLEKLKAKPDVLAKNSQVADLSGEEAKKIAKAADKKQIFPVNQDVWVDELFKVRALSNSECDSIQQRGNQ